MSVNTAIKAELRFLNWQLPWRGLLQAASILLRQMWTWHKHALSRQFLAYCSENEGEKLDPRIEENLRLVSTAKNKNVNAVQQRAWSLSEEQRTEEKKKLPTVCWLAPGESECNFLSCFIVRHFCAKSAISRSCLWSCLLALGAAIGS